MPFTIEGTGSAGAISIVCSTASEAVNKLLELEQHPHGSIIVKDGHGIG